MRAIAWFREKPTAAKAGDINTSIAGVFKPTESINVEEALVRYKTMMIDRFGADDVYINLNREGNDIIIVERIGQQELRWRG